MSLNDVLSQGLLDKISVNADTPGKIKSVGREDCRGSVDSVREGGIWSGTEAFQSIRSGSASGELNQVVVGDLVILAIGLEEGIRVTR